MPARGGFSWWFVAIGFLAALLMSYLRYRYWIPVLDEVREHKDAKKREIPT